MNEPNHNIIPDAFHDLAEDELLPLEPGDRLWKLYVFRPAAGRATHLEHRIYTKIKPDGRLALVTFAVHTPPAAGPVRSGIARVADMAAIDLDRIIDAIRRETKTAADEYEELDLSRVPTLSAQLDRAKGF